ncbi:hypothetical protein HDIA_1371 [Hartmannibacter diazotrophicus]|uniref:DUF3291 domain-containing protein n=1 Tax=Hartmannibacter diazotrophicus TaxID=1482074 RepID=A0A2C9D3N5_9HYPH|nr:DUF3291 domain-containing protein [Hartmannibacter diazotrophicus]SON54912.1 hypothetical protein HDIA_1371 [Hartmannibacter diazotrophicus]
MHLAELNIARLRHPLDDPRTAEFADNLDRVNGIADRMPGFVWRLKDEDGDATAFRISDDPKVIVNLSVWKDAASFETFVWKTVHGQFYGRRQEWFEKMDGPSFAMWWVPEGHVPTLAEAAEKLELLAERGPGEDVFGWEGLPNAREWMTKRCA